MKKDKKIKYTMTTDELKALKKSMEYVKKLDIFNIRKENNNKVKKVA